MQDQTRGDEHPQGATSTMVATIERSHSIDGDDLRDCSRVAGLAGDGPVLYFTTPARSLAKWHFKQERIKEYEQATL